MSRKKAKKGRRVLFSPERDLVEFYRRLHEAEGTKKYGDSAPVQLYQMTKEVVFKVLTDMKIPKKELNHVFQEMIIGGLLYVVGDGEYYHTSFGHEQTFNYNMSKFSGKPK